jgi:hypothetical protein
MRYQTHLNFIKKVYTIYRADIMEDYLEKLLNILQRLSINLVGRQMPRPMHPVALALASLSSLGPPIIRSGAWETGIPRPWNTVT